METKARVAQTKTIKLPIEVWDRIVELLDFYSRPHPDAETVLAMLQDQLSYSPADESAYKKPIQKKQNQ